MNEVEHLRPVVLVGRDGPALWQLADGPMALAIFTDAERAERYASECCGDQGPGSPADGRSTAPRPQWQVKSPDATQTVRMLAACVSGGVRVAALNPKNGEAQRLFDLTEILRDVRERLRRGEPIRF